MKQEAEIQRSWEINAGAWTEAVREQRIASRRAGTDAAAIAAVLESKPARVLDAGCGEGWLMRSLRAHGVHVSGFDASGPLLDRARELGGDFMELTYDQFADDPSVAGSNYDVVIFNFSLLGESIVAPLTAARSILAANGRVIVQTIHPFNDVRDGRYQDEWRIETFESMEGDFRAPMPWYFRTVSTWVRSLKDAGLSIVDLREPVSAEGKLLSLMLIGTGVEGR